MSGEGEETEVLEKPFSVDRAKTGRAACKKCKQKVGVGDLRIGKLAYNPFGNGTMKLWHHVGCLQEVFKKQRKTTKKIENSSDIGGWDTISDADKETIKKSLDWYLSPEQLKNFEVQAVVASEPAQSNTSTSNNDDSFRMFRKICSELTNESSYLGKTAIVKNFFTKGSDNNGFKGDLQLWCRSLLPMAVKRVYNLQSKQLVKIFSDIFRESQEEMLDDLEKGDVAETIGSFFEKNTRKTPAKKAVLTLQEVDAFLVYLAKLTREADQKDHFESILPKCTSNDLKVIIRLIKHDLRINAGPKHILEALHADAYQAFQTSRDLEVVVKNAAGLSSTQSAPDSKKKGMNIGIALMTPVRPMLAEACKSVEFAMKRCPKGMYSEIKYDGERVQLHKKGDEFKYYSRSLKPVTPHKVASLAKYIPMAFPHGKDLILDTEILMMDTNTGEPLPFGTLGKHKKTEFKDATVCLFVFDCIYFNGKSLINETIKERRRILHENMTEIRNHVMFSEMKEIQDPKDLEGMIEEVLRKGLEGLVLKPLHSIYEPGKRHWLKVKKDYLCGGAMADSADLVVLGAWYGTGKKGGIMSVFLMGCHDTRRNCWVTVTKVHGGHDDRTLDSLQKELKMVKISQNVAKVPSWLRCGKTMVPDFVAEDPKSSQVWEITGAEFTCNNVHTADGISIRFPRVTRIRDDKDWETATSLAELKKLYEASKDTSNFTLKGRATKVGNEKIKKAAPCTTKRKAAKKKEDFIDDSDDVDTDVDEEEEEEWDDDDDDDDDSSPVKKKKGFSSNKKKEAVKRKAIQYEADSDDEARPSKGNRKTEDRIPSPPKRKKVIKSDDGTEIDSDDAPSIKKAKSVKGDKNDEKKAVVKGKGIQYETDTEDEASTSKGNRKKEDRIPSPLTRKKVIKSDDETEVDSDDAPSIKKAKSVKGDKNDEKKAVVKGKGIQYETDTEDEASTSKGNSKKEDGIPSSHKQKKVLESADETEIDSDDASSAKQTKTTDTKEVRKDGKKSPRKYNIDTESSSKGVKRKAEGDEAERRRNGIEESPSPAKRVKVADSSSKHEDTSKLITKDGSRANKDSGKRERKTDKLDSPRKTKLDDDDKKLEVDSGSDTEVEENPMGNSAEIIEMANELPDIFKDVVVFLHRKVPDLEKARRYVIAYGGVVYSEERNTMLENAKKKVTHVVYHRRTIDKKVKLRNMEERVKSVSVEWLWDCVVKKRRLDEHRYRVKESSE